MGPSVPMLMLWTISETMMATMIIAVTNDTSATVTQTTTTTTTTTILYTGQSCWP